MHKATFAFFLVGTSCLGQYQNPAVIVGINPSGQTQAMTGGGNSDLKAGSGYIQQIEAFGLNPDGSLGALRLDASGNLLTGATGGTATLPAAAGAGYVLDSQGAGTTYGAKQLFDGNGLVPYSALEQINYNSLSNLPTIPTNTNQLTNGAGFITATGAPVQTVNGASPSNGNVVVGYASTGADQAGAAATAQGNAEAAFTGDVAKAANSFGTTVTALNGTSLSGLGTGLIKLTSGGIPALAVAGTDYPGLGTGNTYTGTQTMPYLVVGNTYNNDKIISAGVPGQNGFFDVDTVDGCFGMYSNDKKLYYGLCETTNPPTGWSAMVPAGNGFGIHGTSANTQTAIFGVTNSGQYVGGQGLASLGFTVEDNNYVSTFSNVLDSGTGGAGFGGPVYFGNVAMTNANFGTQPYIVGAGTSAPTNSCINGSVALVNSASGAVNYDCIGQTWTAMPTLAQVAAATTTAETADQAAFTGDVTKAANSFSTTVTALNGTSLSGLGTGLLKNTTGTGKPTIAVAGTDYVTPGTAITASQLPAFTGDVAKPAGSAATTVTAINGTSLSGLSTGLLKNTTGTGVPSVAVAGTDYLAPFGAQTANTVYAGPATGSAQPSFRALVASDIPATLTSSTSGNAATATTATTAGNLNGTYTQNYVYAAPTGAAGAGSFRALVVGDLPSTVAELNVANSWTATQTFGGINATSVGGTTPGTGAFTTLAASTGYNGVVGNTTPNTGTFTTVAATTASTVLVGTNAVTDAASIAIPVTKRAAYVALTANTTFTMASGMDGQEITLIFLQNATTAYTVTYPTNVHGGFTVGSALGKLNAQHYTYSGTAGYWVADSAGVVNE